MISFLYQNHIHIPTMKTETLILTQSLCGYGYFLKDSTGFCLGTFPLIAHAQIWCNENGYTMKMQP